MLHDPSDNQEQTLSELGFDSLARENLREALESSFREAGKGNKREVFLRTSEKAPRNSQGTLEFPGKG